MVKKVTEKYETRMKLTVPGRGIVTIEGDQAFVGEFFSQVKIRFVEELQKQIKAMQVTGDLEVIETKRGNVTELQVVERERIAS